MTAIDTNAPIESHVSLW